MKFLNYFFKIVLFISISFSFFSNSFAEIKTNDAYETGRTLLAQAREQCQALMEGKGIEAVLGKSMGVDIKSLEKTLEEIKRRKVGIRSEVPTDTEMVEALLEHLIEEQKRGNLLDSTTMTELRRLNLGLFCVQALKMGNAMQKYKEIIAKITRLDHTYNLKRPDKILKEIDIEACKSAVTNGEKQGLDKKEIEATIQYCESITSVPTVLPKADPSISNRLAQTGGSAFDLILARLNSSEQIYRKVREQLDEAIAKKREIVMKDYDQYRTVGLYLCKKTYSGQNPTKVKWWEADCDVREGVHEEVSASIIADLNKKVALAPLEVLLSPLGELGDDGEINSIAKRIYSGVAGEAPWLQQGIYSDFSGSNGGNEIFNSNSPYGSVNTGGGGNNLGIYTGVENSGGSSVGEIRDAEKTKNELLKNINLTIAMYNYSQNVYASSTSICAILPLVKKSETIAKIAEAKSPIEKRKVDIEKRWEEVVKNPTADHSRFFLQMSADLGQTFNQEFVKKVYDANVALLKVCNDAKNGTTTDTNTDNVNVTTNNF